MCYNHTSYTIQLCRLCHQLYFFGHFCHPQLQPQVENLYVLDFSDFKLEPEVAVSTGDLLGCCKEALYYNLYQYSSIQSYTHTHTLYIYIFISHTYIINVFKQNIYYTVQPFGIPRVFCTSDLQPGQWRLAALLPEEHWRFG